MRRDDRQSNASIWTGVNGDVDSSVSLIWDTARPISLDKNHHRTLDTTGNYGNSWNAEDSKDNAVSNRSSRSVPSSDFANLDGRDVVDDCVADGHAAWKDSSEERAANERMHSCTSARRFVACRSNAQCRRNNANEASTNVRKNETSQNTVAQSLALGRVAADERKRNDGSKAKRGRKCRTALTYDLSKKVKSFFRRKSRLAITDSDCTLILPGSRCIRGKRYEKIRGRLKTSQLLSRRNGTSGANSARTSFVVPPKRSRASQSRSSTDVKAKDPLEKSQSISLKTRKTNDNCFIYYRGSKREITPTRSSNAGKRDKRANKTRDCFSESQMLRKRSLLSCIANNGL